MDKLIQLTGQDNNQNTINVYPYTKPEAIKFDNNKDLNYHLANHNHNLATAEKNGFMSALDFIKLLNIEPNANRYYHPKTHSSDMILHKEQSLETFLDNFSAAPQQHTHPATDIVQDENHRFVSDFQKNSWSNKYTREQADERFALKSETGGSNKVTLGSFTIEVDSEDNLVFTSKKSGLTLLTINHDGLVIVENQIRER